MGDWFKDFEDELQFDLNELGIDIDELKYYHCMYEDIAEIYEYYLCANNSSTEFDNDKFNVVKSNHEYKTLSKYPFMKTLKKLQPLKYNQIINYLYDCTNSTTLNNLTTLNNSTISNNTTAFIINFDDDFIDKF